tara:strand:+ start:202 stop:489 length:288 start_codon:yes stop_codon:yes gene_type:complete
MGFKDNLVKQKDGSYLLKSKTKKAKKKGTCIECGENSATRNLLYQYNAEDMILVREYMEDHLIMYSNCETITPKWCSKCKSLINYITKLKDAKSN